jgi:glyoxylase-like metal-dependent hydrolase (beta-lactamase superfamily II)
VRPVPTRAPFICVACGTQYEESAEPPPACPVCEDERQFVPASGQAWTTSEALRETHAVELRELEPDLWGVGTVPAFAIGQRALLVRTRAGNVLWDCLSLLDEGAVGEIETLGGIDAIAISHPHFYGAMVDWSRAFGGAPIYLHEAERDWVRRSHDALVFWAGDARPLCDGITLVRTGGHFPGYQCLHWADGAEGRGVLLSGDQPTVCPDRRHLGFMYSYPNHVPLGPEEVRYTVSALESFAFDRVYGAWWDRVIGTGAKEALRRSAARHLAAIGRS